MTIKNLGLLLCLFLFSSCKTTTPVSTIASEEPMDERQAKIMEYYNEKLERYNSPEVAEEEKEVII